MCITENKQPVFHPHRLPFRHVCSSPNGHPFEAGCQGRPRCSWRPSGGSGSTQGPLAVGTACQMGTIWPLERRKVFFVLFIICFEKHHETIYQSIAELHVIIFFLFEYCLQFVKFSLSARHDSAYYLVNCWCTALPSSPLSCLWDSIPVDHWSLSGPSHRGPQRPGSPGPLIGPLGDRRGRSTSARKARWGLHAWSYYSKWGKTSTVLKQYSSYTPSLLTFPASNALPWRGHFAVGFPVDLTNCPMVVPDVTTAGRFVANATLLFNRNTRNTRRAKREVGCIFFFASSR